MGRGRRRSLAICADTRQGAARQARVDSAALAVHPFGDRAHAGRAVEAVPALRKPPDSAPIRFDDIMDARPPDGKMRWLDAEAAEPPPSGVGQPIRA
jgi:hypothetical protein